MLNWKNPLEGRLGLSIMESAKALGVCQNTIRKEIKHGRLSVAYIGDRPLVTSASLMARLEGRQPPVTAEKIKTLRRGRPRKGAPLPSCEQGRWARSAPSS